MDQTDITHITSIDSFKSLLNYIIKILPVIAGLIFGNKYYYLQRQKQKLANSHPTVHFIKTRENVRQPIYGHNHNCYYIFSAVRQKVPAHDTANIDTGIRFKIPPGYIGTIHNWEVHAQGKVYIREGVVDNSPTSLRVHIENCADIDYEVFPGYVIALLSFCKSVQVKFAEENDEQSGVLAKQKPPVPTPAPDFFFLSGLPQRGEDGDLECDGSAAGGKIVGSSLTSGRVVPYSLRPRRAHGVGDLVGFRKCTTCSGKQCEHGQSDDRTDAMAANVDSDEGADGNDDFNTHDKTSQ